MVQHVAKELDVPEVIANKLEMDGERATGRLHKPYTYGEGKLHFLNEYLRERQLTPDACAAFADSQSDLPLLSAVGHPYAVNPDRALRRTARSHGWPILDLA